MDFYSSYCVLIFFALLHSTASDHGHHMDLRVEEMRVCQAEPADVAFVIDSSNSIWPPDYKTMLSFIQQVISVFPISSYGTRISLVTYADDAKIVANLNDYLDKQQLLRAVQKIRYAGGYATDTARALHTARKILYSESRGGRQGVVKIIVVLTDGRSNSIRHTINQARIAKKMGVHVFAIGIGKKTNSLELLKMASTPSRRYMFRVETFNALHTIKDILAFKACKVTNPPTTTTSSTTTTSTTESTTSAQTSAPSYSAAERSPGWSRETDRKGWKNETGNFFSLPASCDFDLLTCEFAAAQQDYRRAWKTVTGRNKKRGSKNSVNEDHTTGLGRFLRFDPYGMRQGETAKFRSPEFRSFGFFCVEFYYKMPGDGILKVNQIQDSGQYSNLRSFSTSTGSEWRHAQFSSFSLDKVKLELEAVVGSSGGSEVAIDDIKIYHGSCQTSRSQAEIKPIQYMCNQEPADIVFLVDASNSIWGPNFDQVRSFIINMIDVFTISKNMTRVSVVLFGDYVSPQFQLNTYFSKKNITTAVNRMKNALGGTNTAGAIMYMLKTSFKPEQGGRDGVKKIGLVLTDGKSDDTSATGKAASLAKRLGVHMFSIGVGEKVDNDELKLIGSEPAEDYVFSVTTYEALDTIKGIVAYRTCVKLPLQFPGCTKTNDIAFLLDTSASDGIDTLTLSWKFVNRMITQLEGFDKNNVLREAVVPYNSATVRRMSLAQSDDYKSHLQDPDDTNILDLPRAIHHMYKHVFLPQHGGRETARRVAVILMKGYPTDLSLAISEAKRAEKLGIELFVVGIGQNVRFKELQAIASKPDYHVFHVMQPQSLDSQAATQILSEICKS